MLYFPLVDGNFPTWFPVWGGDHFVFFRPVFNVADSYITIGVTLILLFHKKYFVEESSKK
jgi:signal peptidase II